MSSLHTARRSGLAAVAFSVAFVLHLQSQMTSLKIDKFLGSPPTFADIDLTRAAFQNLRFTEAENRELEAALRKPAYRSRIDRRLGTAKVPPGPVLPPRRASRSSSGSKPTGSPSSASVP